jgi:clavulanate-9-aldehyde reductase
VATELREHITNAQARSAIQATGEGMRQLTAEDVASAIVYAVTQPEHASVNEILMRPTDQLW